MLWVLRRGSGAAGWTQEPQGLGGLMDEDSRGEGAVSKEMVVNDKECGRVQKWPTRELTREVTRRVATKDRLIGCNQLASHRHERVLLRAVPRILT